MDHRKFLFRAPYVLYGKHLHISKSEQGVANLLCLILIELREIQYSIMHHSEHERLRSQYGTVLYELRGSEAADTVSMLVYL